MTTTPTISKPNNETRAARIARIDQMVLESIRFRLSLIPEIHKEIHDQIWSRWLHYNQQRILHEDRSKKPTTCGAMTGLRNGGGGQYRRFKAVD